MTAVEMQIKFEQLLKTHDIKNINILDITSNISYYLTESQRQIVEQYYEIFETNEKARQVLLPLVINSDLRRKSVNETQTGIHPNGEYWVLPANLMYILKEEATLNVDSCGIPTLIEANRNRALVKPVNIDYYLKHKDSPFKKPYKDVVWRMDVSYNSTREHPTNTHELITDGSQVVKYHVTYIKYPPAISIEEENDSILPELIHQDIVTGAVTLALRIIQTTINLTNK